MKFKLGDSVWSTKEGVGGTFIESNGDGTCAISTGAVVLSVDEASLITTEEWLRRREEQRKNAPTWDEILNG